MTERSFENISGVVVDFEIFTCLENNKCYKGGASLSLHGDFFFPLIEGTFVN
jgi:hypothetical protein